MLGDATDETALWRLCKDADADPDGDPLGDATAVALLNGARNEEARASGYHAGSKNCDRTDSTTASWTGTLHVVVVTIAFGMGIDKAEVRFVYHLHISNWSTPTTRKPDELAAMERQPRLSCSTAPRMCVAPENVGVAPVLRRLNCS